MTAPTVPPTAGQAPASHAEVQVRVLPAVDPESTPHAGRPAPLAAA